MNMGKSTKLILITTLLLVLPALILAQYTPEVPKIPGLNTRSSVGSASFLGIDLSKVDFQNSYSMQVSSFGNDAVAMGLLKSSFNYAINPQVSVQGSVGLLHSPFSSMAPIDEKYSFLNGLNADNLFYSGEITYRPRENMSFQIGFSRMPTNAYNQFYSPYSSPYSYRRLGY